MVFSDTEGWPTYQRADSTLCVAVSASYRLVVPASWLMMLLPHQSLPRVFCRPLSPSGNVWPLLSAGCCLCVGHILILGDRWWIRCLYSRWGGLPSPPPRIIAPPLCIRHL